MLFSQEQRVFILEQYLACLSYARVKNALSDRYPDEAVPNNLTITRLIAHFRENGSVADRKSVGRPTILTTAKLAELRKGMLRSPIKSLRRLSVNSQLSYG